MGNSYSEKVLFKICMTPIGKYYNVDTQTYVKTQCKYISNIYPFTSNHLSNIDKFHDLLPKNLCEVINVLKSVIYYNTNSKYTNQLYDIDNSQWTRRLSSKVYIISNNIRYNYFSRDKAKYNLFTFLLDKLPPHYNIHEYQIFHMTSSLENKDGKCFICSLPLIFEEFKVVDNKSLCFECHFDLGSANIYEYMYVWDKPGLDHLNHKDYDALFGRLLDLSTHMALRLNPSLQISYKTDISKRLGEFERLVI